MPTRAPRTCPRCHTRLTPAGCPTCNARTEARRGSAAERGYDAGWARNRARYLAAHPRCALCGKPSEVPDHHPKSRRQLVAEGDPHPDSWDKLRPLCAPCHRRETARNQPGGWNARD